MNHSSEVVVLTLELLISAAIKTYDSHKISARVLQSNFSRHNSNINNNNNNNNVVSSTLSSHHGKPYSSNLRVIYPQPAPPSLSQQPQTRREFAPDTLAAESGKVYDIFTYIMGALSTYFVYSYKSSLGYLLNHHLLIINSNSWCYNR